MIIWIPLIALGLAAAIDRRQRPAPVDLSVDRPSYLYHTTRAANLPAIRELGLDPSAAGRWLYLAADPGQSMAYDAWYTGEPVVLLRVALSALDPGLLGPDDIDLKDLLEQDSDSRHWSDVDWQESLEKSGQVTYAGVIPPEAIEVVRRWLAVGPEQR